MTQTTFSENKRGGSLWTKVIVVGVFLLIVLMAWRMFDGYERAYRTFYRPVLESRQNPYFVAGEYLKTQGKTIHWGNANAPTAFQTLIDDTANAKGRLLIIDTLEVGQTSQVQSIIDWAKAGGHVIVYAKQRLDKTSLDELDDSDHEQYDEFENPLLARLGIYFLALPDYVKYDGQAYNFLPNCDAMLNIDGKLVRLGGQFDGQCGQLHIAGESEFVPYDYQVFTPNMTLAELQARLGKLDDNKRVSAFLQFLQSNPSRYHPANALLDGQLGQGRLTVLTDEDIFSNPYPTKVDASQIAPPTKRTLWDKLGHRQSDMAYDGKVADYDRAFLLHFLSKDSRDVWFFANLTRPSFWAVLWQNFAFGLVALALMAVAMVLALPRQFGRQKTVLDDSGYNVLRYFEQVAGYLWQVDKMQRQVATNRTALQKRLKARIAPLSAVAIGDEMADEWCHQLAVVLDIEPDVVFLALFAEWDNRAEFLSITQALAEVERRFGEMGRG